MVKKIYNFQDTLQRTVVITLATIYKNKCIYKVYTKCKIVSRSYKSLGYTQLFFLSLSLSLSFSPEINNEILHTEILNVYILQAVCRNKETLILHTLRTLRHFLILYKF